MTDKKSPNFLTCPIEPEGSASTKAPAPKNLPVRDGAEEHPLPRIGPPERSVPVATQTPLERAMPKVTGKTRSNEMSRRVKKPRYVLWTILALLAIFLVTAGPAAYALTRAGISAQYARTALLEAASSIEQRDLRSAEQRLEEARIGLTDARDSLRGVGFWRDVPGVGTQVRALEDAMAAGAATIDGMHQLFSVVTDILDAAATVNSATGELINPVEAHRSFNDLSRDEKRAILARLSRAIPDIRAAQAKVDVALETWNRVPQDALFAPLQKAFQPVAANLPRLKKSLDEAIPLLEVMIPLAGYPSQADYLVVLQNTDEIRATGGFLGTWGILSVDGGELNEFSFNDVYALDNPVASTWKDEPPEALRERLGVNAWFFRDSNWSPDFPTSAQRMSDVYVREMIEGTGKGVKAPDGVIALNPPVFEALLRMVGPITVDDVTFTADNFFDELEYEVEQRFLQKGIPVDQRKQILLKVGDQLIQKLASLPASKWPDLLDLFTESFENKQIQMYARDPALLARLDAFGWTGRTKPTNGDFVWVIDSNLAALKTDGVMQKNIRYRIDASDPNNPIATVTLRYTNNAPGFKEFRYTRYRDYVRLYVPDGSELISVEGAMKNDRYLTGGRVVPGKVDVYKELGKTVFGAFWSIEPRQTQEIVFTYRLPSSVSDQLKGTSYHLDIPKQSGNDSASLTLDLRFGKKLERATPPEEPIEFGDAEYRLETDTAHDRAFDIHF